MLWLIRKWGLLKTLDRIVLKGDRECLILSQQMLNTEINLNITGRIDWDQIAGRLPRASKNPDFPKKIRRAPFGSWTILQTPWTTSVFILKRNLLTLHTHSWRCFKYHIDFSGQFISRDCLYIPGSGSYNTQEHSNSWDDRTPIRPKSDFSNV